MVFIALLFPLILIILFFNFIWSFIIMLSKSIYAFLFEGYRYKKITKQVHNSDVYKKRKLEEKILKEEKENKHQEQILKQQNKIVKAGLNKVRNLRIRYPFANEELFQYFLKKFPSYSVDDLNIIENNIKKSHIENEKIVDKNKKRNYTLNDLDNYEPLEIHRENPLVMKIYKINIDYILYIRDIDTNNIQLLQSKDYLVICTAINEILKKQKKLKKIKKSIKSENVEVLFNDIKSNRSRYE